MDNIKEIKKLEKELNKIKEKINLFFDLMQNGIKSAKEAQKDEIPLVFANEDMKEIILYDVNKDRVYNVPIENLVSLKSECSNKGYILDITNLLSEYVKITIKLLYKIDMMKGLN